MRHACLSRRILRIFCYTFAGSLVVFNGLAFASGSSRIRAVAAGGYAYGAKDFPDQIRGGVNFLYAVWASSEVGATVEAGFQNATVVCGGPIFVHQISWPRIGSLRTGVFGGFPVVYISQAGNSDFLFGLKMGIELGYPLAKFGGHTLDLVSRGGAEVFLFGSNQVAIPVIGSLGIGYRF